MNNINITLFYMAIFFTKKVYFFAVHSAVTLHKLSHI